MTDAQLMDAQTAARELMAEAAEAERLRGEVARLAERVRTLELTAANCLDALEWAIDNELDPAPTFILQARNVMRFALKERK